MNTEDLNKQELVQLVDELKQQIALHDTEKHLLQEGMQKYQTLFTHAPLGILHYDTEGTILDVNIEFVKIIGSSREALIGLKMFKQLNDVQLLSEVRKSLNGGIGHFEGIYHSVTANKVTPVRGIFVTLRDETGQVVGGTGIIEDVSGRRKAEAEIEESRERYRGLSEAAFEAIFISEKGICIEQNFAAEKMFGYTSEEAIGRYGTEWIVPEDRDRVMQNMMAGYEESYEAKALRKDGTIFPCSLRGKMMHYKGKTVRVTSLSDISSQKEAEEALRVKDWAIESAINAFAITNQSGHLQYVNPAFLRLWGYDSPSEVLGKSPTSFWLMEVKASEVMGKLMSQENWSGELIAVNKQGGLFDVQVEASLVKDSEGRPNSMLASFQDVTERKKMISYLRDAKEKAEAGNRLKTAFMNNISHELRTPLNGILGFTSLIIQSDISQEEREHFHSLITTSSNRLLRTITNYMDVSLLASGNIEVRKKPFDLHRMLHHIRQKFLPLYTEKNLELVLEIPFKTETLRVFSDAELLQTVFSHLLDNALAFTYEGSIYLGYQKQTRAIEFYVKDTGIGIQPESVNEIFESFVQGKTSTKNGQEGSGLGLSIAQGFVRLLGGEIRVESEPGRGSAFYFSIPDNGAIEAPPEPEEIINTFQLKVNPIILVAENDSANFQLIEVMLRGTGITVLAAADGREAVSKCRENENIALVLMDLKMPVLDGFEATRQIKSFRHDLPVLAVTAFALSGDEKRAIESGCNDYLAKPFDKTVLLNKLKRYGITA